MDFGGIIKRAWRITWRYKALWVLGIFAGVSGCQGGGSGGGSGGSSGGSGTNGSLPGAPDMGEFARLYERIVDALPLIMAALAVLVVVGIVWSVLAIAARGALVTGVNAAEEQTLFTLGELWRSGFSHFWSLVGLDILLSLPLFAVGMLMLIFILVPLIATISAGGVPGPDFIAPVCGSLVLGVPVLAIGGFVLGVMHLIAIRYVMLGGQGAFEAAGNSWRFFRARFKDTLLVWLLNAALNLGASFVVAVPAVVVGIAVAIPAAVSASSGDFGALLAVVPVVAAFVIIVGLAYNAVWGTFTSALWTLYFRDVQGMGAPKADDVTPAYTIPPAPPAPPQSEVLGPPIAGHEPGPEPFATDSAGEG